MSELGRAERFLDAFNRIDGVLRRQAKANDKKSTLPLLIEKTHALSPAQKKKLQGMVKLRNVIVHEPRGSVSEIIADPRESSVEWMELQAEVLEKPPKVLEALNLQAPELLDGVAEIDKFLDSTRPPKNFSQVPFRDRDGRVNLITTNALARWVAASYQARDGLLLSASSIEEVSKFAEEQDAPIFRPRDLKVVDAIRIFAGETGHAAPAAIMLSHSGKDSETPIGICTSADVPAMYKALGM